MTFPKAGDEAIFEVIEHGQAWHPRSQQTLIGPSGLGDPCDIAVIHGLVGDEAPRKEFSGWKMTVGTAVHAWLEAQFMAANERLGRRRWITERRVFVGMLGSRVLTGSMDLYDCDTDGVYDFKSVGPRMLTKYVGNGPSETYRQQGHLYGRGMENLGLTPATVGIIFLPRDGELTSSHVWREPYDHDQAEATLDRARGILHTLETEFGGDAAAFIAACSPCDETYCDWCRPNGRRVKVGVEGGVKSMFD